MKIYIAAPYPMRTEAVVVMESLKRMGHEVTSSWLQTNDDLSDYAARTCLNDIDAADAMLALNFAGWEDRGTGGRHVELGYALGKNKRVFLIGKRSNLFHYHSNVVVIGQLRDIDKHAWAVPDA